MTASQFSAAQIIPILRAADVGAETVEHQCRKPGIAEATIPRWHAKYGGLAKTWYVYTGVGNKYGLQ